jgi:hypothetical protein
MGCLPDYSRSLQGLLQQRFDLLGDVLDMKILGAYSSACEKLMCNVYCSMNNEMIILAL